MKSVKLSIVALAVLAFGLAIGFTPAFARSSNTTPSATQYAQKQMPEQHSRMKQTFVGTIRKSANGMYVLRANGENYRLTDQSKAARYVDKEVKVTGVLNARTRTIDVTTIEPAK